MSDRDHAARAEPTPNQLGKQRQIVAATQAVLLRHGVAGCTAREVAAAGPLTKSAIHYYFADMDRLIDLAMGEYVTAFVETLRRAGDDAPEPVAAFWRTVDAYLGTFRDQPSAAQLWFEYWITVSRSGRLAAITAMHQQVIDLLVRRLDAAGLRGGAGRAVFVHLLGAVVDQAVDPGRSATIRSQVAVLAGLDPPA